MSKYDFLIFFFNGNININIEHVFQLTLVTNEVNLHIILHLLYLGGKVHHGIIENKVHTS